MKFGLFLAFTSLAAVSCQERLPEPTPMPLTVEVEAALHDGVVQAGEDEVTLGRIFVPSAPGVALNVQYLTLNVEVHQPHTAPSGEGIRECRLLPFPFPTQPESEPFCFGYALSVWTNGRVLMEFDGACSRVTEPLDLTLVCSVESGLPVNTLLRASIDLGGTRVFEGDAKRSVSLTIAGPAEGLPEQY